MSPLYPASFSPHVPPRFLGRNLSFEMGRDIQRIHLISEWNLGSLDFDDPDGLEKSRLLNTPQKWSNRGWYGSRGLFLYSGCQNRTQAYTGRTARYSYQEKICPQQKTGAASFILLTAPVVLYGVSSHLCVYSCVLRFQNQKAPALAARRTAATAIHGSILPADSWVSAGTDSVS